VLRRQHRRHDGIERLVGIEKGHGIDVGSNWLTHVLAALGLGTLRAGITGANK